ncbi:MAG: hypothetical protein WCH34_14520 [Bacteroidota bacterium]
MDKIQEGKNLTCNELEAFLNNTENAQRVNGWIPLKNSCLHFKGNLVLVQEQIGISQFDFTQITADQNTARINCAEFMNENICSGSRSYFRKLGDKTSLGIFKPTVSKMSNYPLSGVISFLTNMINKAEYLMTNVPAYATATGIDAGTISDANDLKDILSGLLGKAKEKQNQIDVALEKITEIQKEIWEFDFPNMIDDAQHYNSTFPDFSKQMAEIMKIENLPTSHTGINGYMHDEDGNVIIGGTITNLDMPDRKPMVTDNLGYYSDQEFKWGVYRYKYSHPDFHDQIITIKITRGKKFVQNVIMKKK